MCLECGINPCDSRCPNAPEPEAVCSCSCCKEDIEDGDDYVEFEGEYYCTWCLDDMTTRELVELFGGTWKTAGED